MSDKVYVGQKVQSFESKGEYEPFSRVTMWYDDEHCYTAGDDTGRTLECENPWATQQIVDNVLKQVKGYVYRPFEAKGVELDMAAELGDGVTVCGTYSVLGHITRHMDALGLCDIGAPGEKEINHEYPYKSSQDRELKRRVKLGQAYQGVKITRLDGLTVAEMQEDGKEGAKVILNSKKLAFYGADGQEQLYFDPAAGCYKFRGALNVNDNFIVDKLGNVTLNGSIKWGVGNAPNKKRYATSTSGPWHDTMQSGDIYCCDWDYTEEKWGEPYKFKGQDGAAGSDGDPKGYLKSIQITEINKDGVKSPLIQGARIEGAEIWGGKITADTTIEVGTDATIGRWLKLKSPTGKDEVGIVFHGDVVGEAPGLWSDNDKFINITANYLGLIGSGLKDSRIGLNTPLLDLTYVSKIEWGNNKPKAYFE